MRWLSERTGVYEGVGEYSGMSEKVRSDEKGSERLGWSRMCAMSSCDISVTSVAAFRQQQWLSAWINSQIRLAKQCKLLSNLPQIMPTHNVRHRTPLDHFKRSCMYSVPCAPCVCTLERRCWRWSDHRKHFTISNSPLCIRDPKSRRRCRKYISLISCPCVCI